jgi:hypothetical protein
MSTEQILLSLMDMGINYAIFNSTGFLQTQTNSEVIGIQLLFVELIFCFQIPNDF